MNNIRAIIYKKKLILDHNLEELCFMLDGKSSSEQIETVIWVFDFSKNKKCPIFKMTLILIYATQLKTCFVKI